MRLYMVKPCLKEMKCDVELSSYAIRDAEEYKNFCDRPKDQRPQPEEVIAAAATANLISSNGHDLSNHTTGGNVQADGPMQTAEILHHTNCQSSLLPNEAHLNSFVSSPADGLLIEAAHQSESSGLDSPDLLFDFDRLSCYLWSIL